MRTLERRLPRAVYSHATRRPRVLRTNRRAVGLRRVPNAPLTPRQRVRWTVQMILLCLLAASATYSYVARLLERDPPHAADDPSEGGLAALER